MNIYSQKQKWKSWIFATAVIIGVSSLLYTNRLIDKLSIEERKKVELWASAYRELQKVSESGNIDIGFITEVIINNETVPVLLVDIDEEGNEIINYARNLDSIKINEDKYLRKQLEIMKSENEPIEITLPSGDKNYIYYKDSIILTQLIYYPYFQLAVIFIFILISYYAFSISRKAEQNQVWVGLSKETAHQLGTPISSLIGWLEYLKIQQPDNKLLPDIENDVKRLETITERFSKIGSNPVLSKNNINIVLEETIAYLKRRTSTKVKYDIIFPDHDVNVPLNKALFEWVIENICKNAVDAMDGKGEISISVTDLSQNIYIDIKDTGKGLSKSQFKTIFNPGYTTKQRGWGLGLSLAHRIIEVYHDGKIFVKNSGINLGTTFRIVLKKNIS